MRENESEHVLDGSIPYVFAYFLGHITIDFLKRNLMEPCDSFLEMCAVRHALCATVRQTRNIIQVIAALFHFPLTIAQRSLVAFDVHVQDVTVTHVDSMGEQRSTFKCFDSRLILISPSPLRLPQERRMFCGLRFLARRQGRHERRRRSSDDTAASTGMLECLSLLSSFVPSDRIVARVVRNSAPTPFGRGGSRG